MQGSQHEFSFGGRGDFLLNTPTVVALQCQISKSCCTKVNLLFLEKYTTRCTLFSLLFIKLWVIKHLFFSDNREISSAEHRRVKAQKNLSLSLSKNSIWILVTNIQTEEEFCTFKACESLKDFMVTVEALIKPLGYQKKIDWQLNWKMLLLHCFICGVTLLHIFGKNFATFSQFTITDYNAKLVVSNK